MTHTIIKKKIEDEIKTLKEKEEKLVKALRINIENQTFSSNCGERERELKAVYNVSEELLYIKGKLDALKWILEIIGG